MYSPNKAMHIFFLNKLIETFLQFHICNGIGTKNRFITLYFVKDRQSQNVYNECLYFFLTSNIKHLC